MRLSPFRFPSIHLLLFALILAAAPQPGRATDYLTQRFDIGRTGWNPNETFLNTGNVSATTFGRLWSVAVDGQVYAQPLYVSGLDLPDGTRRNVLFVATEHNTIYAFDADAGPHASALWPTSLGPSVPKSVVGCDDIEGPWYGITSTPVIDRAAGILYAVAKTRESGRQLYRLHALDLRTGAELPGWPAVIQGSVPAPDGSPDAEITFDAAIQHQRPGLLLLGGRVWIGFGSHCDFSIERYHGWVFGLSATDPSAAPLVFCSTPEPGLFSDEAGGIWQGGIGLAGDAAGSIYFMTGNGPLTAPTGSDVGDSFVRLHSRADAAGYAALKGHRSPIRLGTDYLRGIEWRVLVAGAGLSSVLRSHIAAYSDPAYDDSGTDPFTGVAWQAFPYMPGDAGSAGRKGTPGGIPDNADYIARLRLTIPASLIPPGTAGIRAALNQLNVADQRLGVYLNGVRLAAGAPPYAYEVIRVPPNTVRVDDTNALVVAGHHASGPAGFTQVAPVLEITAVSPTAVPPGGLFNGYPDDFYAPSNADSLEQSDTDLGSGGAVVLPDMPGAPTPRLLLGVGKDGMMRLLNRDSLGGVQLGPDHAVAHYLLASGDSWKVFGAPAYWEGPAGRFVYCAASRDVLRQFHLGDEVMGPGITPVHAGPLLFDFPGSSPAVSSDGSRQGTGIVWTLDRGTNSLCAYDAEDVSHLLYSSGSAPKARSVAPGQVIKFSVPTPVDGRVFVGSTNRLTAYGLLRAPGDADGDGRITLKDTALILRMAVGVYAPTNDEQQAADLDASGSVDLADAVLSLRMTLGA